MSFHRENVIWQSKDGTWSRGFFETYDTGRDGDDWDPEWDIEYDFSRFRWVSTGHPSQDGARRSWDGANPGGFSALAYSDGEEVQRQVEEYDDIAARLWEAGGRQWYCSGQPKRRVPWLIARDIARGLVDTAHFKLGGYANVCPDVTSLKQQLTARIPELSTAERQHVVDTLNEGVETIRKMLDQPRRLYAGAKEARQAMEDLQVQGWSILAENPSPAAPANTNGTVRRKTTAVSTSGSFAPKTNTPPTTRL